MEAKIIERFTPTLVVAVCDCVHPVTDACMANQLITGETGDDILGSTTSEDKTRKLLKAVKNSTEINSESFNTFLRILREKLPEKISPELLTDMETQLPSEQGQAIPIEATVPSSSGHEAEREARRYYGSSESSQGACEMVYCMGMHVSSIVAS